MDIDGKTLVDKLSWQEFGINSSVKMIFLISKNHQTTDNTSLMCQIVDIIDSM